MNRILFLLIILLSACTSWRTPTPSHDWRLTPTGGPMWRFQYGDARTSALLDTVPATAAQVTRAGLTVTLDEWGGSKEATWSGLTGPVQDKARVWIDVQDAAAPGGWRRVFSGVLTRRPASSAGSWQALGDKYHRLRRLPVARASSAPTDAERAQALQPGGDPDLVSLDAGSALRKLGIEAQVDLPHLVVTPAGVPDAGVTLQRTYKGESLAAAFDALAAARPGWGWTTRPDDTLYLGPPVAREAVLTDGVRGVQVTWRDVVSEGLLNAIVWQYELSGDQVIRYESRHASVPFSGRYAQTRWLSSRSYDAVVTTYGHPKYLQSGTAEEFQLTGALADGLNGVGDPVNLVFQGTLRLALIATGSWAQVAFVVGAGGQATLSVVRPGGTSSTTYTAGDAPLTVVTTVPGPFAALDELRLTSDTPGVPVGVQRFTVRTLRFDVLDAEAARAYVIPPDAAATASESGLQAPAGQARVVRPGREDVTERVVGTRYVVRQPTRTEYLIGEPDYPADAQALRVVIDRKDDDAVDAAVTTRSARDD